MKIEILAMKIIQRTLKITIYSTNSFENEAMNNYIYSMSNENNDTI